jgi:hypothetical protein
VKPFYQAIAQLTTNQKAYLTREVGFSINQTIYARYLYRQKRTVVTPDYSFDVLPVWEELDSIVEPYIGDVSKSELDEYLLSRFGSFYGGRFAIHNGLYFNFHNTFVARYKGDTSDDVIEVDYRRLKTLLDNSPFCKLGEPHISKGGLSFVYNGKIVGTVVREQTEYVDPYTYRKRGMRLEDGKIKCYSQFTYNVDETGNEVRL